MRVLQPLRQGRPTDPHRTRAVLQLHVPYPHLNEVLPKLPCNPGPADVGAGLETPDRQHWRPAGVFREVCTADGADAAATLLYCWPSFPRSHTPAGRSGRLAPGSGFGSNWIAYATRYVIYGRVNISASVTGSTENLTGWLEHIPRKCGQQRSHFSVAGGRMAIASREATRDPSSGSGPVCLAPSSNPPQRISRLGGGWWCVLHPGHRQP